jgi:NAD(P)-dependent dehydrogenase (short-subunit alcohol dehydrogenase family)
MKMFDFSDRVVIVTGAAGNLGSAVARAFQMAGAKLVLVDRAADRLPRLFPELVDSPNHFLATSVDLTNADAVETMMNETVKRFGRVDVLVNTAGGFRAGTPVHETPFETWDFMLNLNARTVFIASRAVIPHMQRQGSGKIVNVASRAALQGGAKMAAYSVSKSAVIRLTESMAAELKKDGINVNCILPSTIDTPQNRQAMPDANYSRWVKPEAIADVILFLASAAARAIQGAAIPVYGQG